MPDPTTQASVSGEFLRGTRPGLAVAVASFPFAILYGALAVQNGLTVTEATLASATIYGGASQMVGIELFGQSVAPWLIVLSIFAVNFRHLLYSAVLGRRLAHWSWWQKTVGFFFLVDPQFAEGERQGEEGRGVGFAWYMGMGIATYIPWVFNSWLGARFGSLIPDANALGLDYLLPIYFMGMVIEFRERPLWLPVVVVSGVAAVVAYHTVGSPWHVSIGAVAGIALAVALSPSRPAQPLDASPDEAEETV
ncbi:MAG: AzlC family ABC transporter permease [Rhizobiaceae bacterium]